MTHEQRADILESLRAGCSLDVALRAARVKRDAFAAYCATDREYERSLDVAREAAKRETRAVEWSVAAAASARAEEDRKAAEAAKVDPKRKPSNDVTRGPASIEDVAREAALYAPGDFGYVLLVDARCVAAGMPAMSPWWRASVGAFYASGKPWGIFLVGRGGGKSTTLERVAASVARYGDRSVPPGQVWTWPFVSVGPDDANRRIDGIAAVLRADGMKIIGDYESDGSKVKDGIKITHAPRGCLDLEDARGNAIRLASIAGTVGNLSGPSTIGLTIDEAAKLRDASGANPLTEIVASAAQTSRGRAGWRAIMSSSAYDRAGIHFQLVQQGDSATNFVATIGAEFLDAALDGFERVAAWEQRRGDAEAAKIVRAHASSLKSDSPLIPTWVANPTLGNPQPGVPWDGASLASRMLVEVLPETALDGVPRIRFWLRECGSVPLDRGSNDYAAQCALAAAITARVNGRQPRDGGPDIMPVAGAPPGDPRHGPMPQTVKRTHIGWRTRGF